MRRDKLIKLTLICILVGLSVWVVATAFRIGSFERRDWRLGLDLQGGTHLVYQADTTDVADPEGTVALVKDIIEKRVNAYGVSEPIIQIQGNNRISVQLPGVKDIEEALKLIGATAKLDFRKMAETEEDGKAALTTDVSLGDTILAVDNVSTFTVGDSVGLETRVFTLQGNDVLIADDSVIEAIDTNDNTIALKTALEFDWDAGQTVQKWIPATGTIGEDPPIQLTGAHFKPDAAPFFPQQGSTDIVVAFNLKDDGIELFRQITGALKPLNKRLGIFMDDEIISAPQVQAELTTGGHITGLNINEARLLAIQLNQGALPLTLTIKSQQDVSATLGADSLKKSLWAGGIGLMLVLVFMIAYYRLPGLLASLALVIYALIVLSIFKLVPVTLTLAGIAAFVLSIGMAVDANVLIFERMREEIRFGRTVGAAIESGFDRAWSSIRDSNISTIITCIVLFFFGRALGATVVMGFAVTLLIGVLMSMFTAIVITKTFLRAFVGTRIAKKISLFYSGSRGRHSDV
jgi:preprotein translocase subunit SecD